MLLVRGGICLMPSDRLERADLLMDGGLIAAVEPAIAPEAGMEVFDAGGLIVAPGLIDMHVHLRDPGFEYKEDIRSGLEAAAAGGFTSVMAMPNTQPVCDNAAVVRYMLEKASGVSGAALLVCGSISKGLEGRELALIGEMAEAGIVAISDDGKTVMNSELMRLALLYAGRFNLPLISHCLDNNLAGEGVMHLGEVSLRLGLRGIPGAAEDVIVARDTLLAEETGGRLHIAHVSTARSAEIIRQARGRGCRVTAEATPHHLLLTHEAVEGYDTSTKVSPPLRTEQDCAALLRGLGDGTIEVIATDHAPHSREDKEVEYDLAPSGLIGMETALPVLLTALVHTGRMSLELLLQALSKGPANALGLPGGCLQRGKPGDLTIIDPQDEHVIRPEKFRSKSINTPFAGWKVKGRAAATVAGGRIIYRR